ncbi:MAG: hypothetical protein ACPG4N_03370 [Gammaproteobacteria bacterium]
MSPPNKHPNPFEHDQSRYERPLGKHRCGRGCHWQKPCWQGPNAEGRCGGTSECTPVRKGDGWECQRPKHAGGKCEQGPLPDGQCCKQQPACNPRLTLRGWRSRWAWFGLFLVAALLVLGTNLGLDTGKQVLALNPGDLSSVHAGFTMEQGCGACHTGHGEDVSGWVSAAFKNSDTSPQCLNCHRFDGPGTLAHNNEAFGNSGERRCTACHVEHQGIHASIERAPANACANCHEGSFSEFAQDHPPFDSRFPHQIPATLQFDHAKHLGEYFSSPQWTKKKNRDAAFAAQAKDDCTTCHAVDNATNEVKPMAYERICAGCHQTQVTQAGLPLLYLEELTPLSALLLAMDPEDADEDEVIERIQGLLESIAETGPDALAETMEESFGASSDSNRLLRGMGLDSIQTAARQWLEEEEVEQVETEKMKATGWIAGADGDDNQALFYLPAGHGDPVIRAWIEQASAIARDEEHELQVIAEAALEELINPEGPGACGKCHRAGIVAPSDSPETALSWGRTGTVKRAHTHYSHTPHLNLIDSRSACTDCHRHNPDAKYENYFEDLERAASDYQSNFLGISKDSCTQCHRPNMVSSDCQLCHNYHRSPGFNLAFRKQGMPKTSQKGEDR